MLPCVDDRDGDLGFAYLLADPVYALAIGRLLPMFTGRAAYAAAAVGGAAAVVASSLPLGLGLLAGAVAGMVAGAVVAGVPVGGRRA